VSFHHNSCVIVALAIVAAMSDSCASQEVGSVDLTKITARTELRSPSRPRRGLNQVHGCFNSASNAGELRTTLVSLDSTEYRIGDEPRFEVTVENVGSAPLKIPFSPHLADLQPVDPSQKFAYSVLDVVLWIGGAKWSANTGGTVVLYGADDHPETLLTLQPGEWARIIGKGNIALPADGSVVNLIRLGDVADHVNARVTLYSTETLLAPEGGATVSREVCLNQGQGRSVPITVTESK